MIYVVQFSNCDVKYVLSLLVTNFMHMRLNVNGHSKCIRVCSMFLATLSGTLVGAARYAPGEWRATAASPRDAHQVTTNVPLKKGR